MIERIIVEIRVHRYSSREVSCFPDLVIVGIIGVGRDYTRCGGKCLELIEGSIGIGLGISISISGGENRSIWTIAKSPRTRERSCRSSECSELTRGVVVLCESSERSGLSLEESTRKVGIRGSESSDGSIQVV